jgi:deoxyribonuclease-4
MIRNGPGGTAGLGYAEGIAEIARLGLNALEVEFTHGVNLPNVTSKAVGELAKKNGISLSVHAPYFINLASAEKAKIVASIKRIMDSCERAHYMGAAYVVYHSGFFGKEEPAKVKEMIIENTKLIVEKIKENKWKTMIAPELTGKPSQFGSIPELLELRDKCGCEITVDFAHQRARQQGDIDYGRIFDELKGLKHIHAHFSGIEWTEKGERNHVITEREDILPLAREILKRKADITLINESPDPIGDAYKTKRIFEELSK